VTRSIWYKRLRTPSNGLLDDILSIAVIGLVVLGLGGTLYKALKPGGWLTLLLDRLWDESPWLVWLLGFGSAVLLALGRRRLGRGSSVGMRGEILVYTFLALGLFFFFKLVVTGGL
jgi:hypothetical protein